MAGPPFCPGNQASRTALTLESHGITWALEFSMTTMVCGLAAATAETKRILIGCQCAGEIGEVEAGHVHAFAGPLADEDDGDLGGGGEGARRMRR